MTDAPHIDASEGILQKFCLAPWPRTVDALPNDPRTTDRDATYCSRFWAAFLSRDREADSSDDKSLDPTGSVASPRLQTRRDQRTGLEGQ